MKSTFKTLIFILLIIKLFDFVCEFMVNFFRIWKQKQEMKRVLDRYSDPRKPKVVSYKDYNNRNSHKVDWTPKIDRPSYLRPDYSGFRNKYKFDNRTEAENILISLRENIDVYGTTSLADFYSLMDIENQYSDNRYGWTDLKNTTVKWVEDGYMINLPKPVPIN